MTGAATGLKTAAALALSALAPFASASGWRAVASSLAAPGLQAEGIELLAAPVAAGPPPLELRVRRLRLESLALELPDLRLSCTPQAAADAWHCGGVGGWVWEGVRVEGEAQVALAGEHVTLAWRGGPAQVRFAADLARGSLAVAFSGAPLGALAGWAGRLWPGVLLQRGVAEGRFELDWGGARAELRGSFGIEGLGFDTADGSAGAVDAALTADLALRLDGAPEARIEASFSGGEWLLGPLYLELGAEDALSLETVLAVPPAGGVVLRRLRLSESGVFALEGEMAWAPGAALPESDLGLRVLDLSRFLARRAGGLAAIAGFAGLAGAGSVEIRAALAGGRLAALAFASDGLGLEDAKGRFALKGLAGSFEFAAAPRSPEGELRGEAAAIFGIAAGPWRARLRHEPHGVALLAPLRVELLDGAVILEEGRIARGRDGATEATLAVAVEKLSLGALASHLGWPRFPGTVSGRLPQARYHSGRIDTEGVLQIAVFGGRIEASELALERPFGSLPTLSADLRLERLDLAQITGVFDFGLIEGRLSGRIDGLRLVDWNPVAFSARLATERSGWRRISQRAVDNLAALGGGGAAAALQRGVVGAFASFAYDELGLSCVLARQVCTMGGVDSAGAGYFILRGRGLPRVDVIGHQREVDWPVLVARLKAAIAAGGPEVER